MVEDSEIEKITVAPRVRPQDLEDNIAATHVGTAYEMFEALGHPVSEDMRYLTIAVLVLKNGFTMVGQSACASPANFDREIGSRLAIEDAKRGMWSIMGYHLKQVLHEQGSHDLVGSGEAEQQLDQMLNKLKDKDA